MMKFSSLSNSAPTAAKGREVSTPRGPYAVKVIKSEDQLRNLRDDWTRLSAGSPAGIFSSFDWTAGWWEHVGRNPSPLGKKELFVLAITGQEGICGIAPFIIREPSRSGFGIRKVEFIGSTFNDYNDLLFQGDLERQVEALAESLAAHSSEFDIIDLRSFPEGSNLPGYLTAALEKCRLKARTRTDDPCPYVELTSDWEGMLPTFSRSARMTLQNQANRLIRAGDQGLRVRVIENPHNEPGLLRRLAEVESRKQLDGAPGNSLLRAFSGFFEHLIKTFGPQGRLYVAVMEQSERMIAYQLGFRSGMKLWDYTTAYDPAYSKHSPGTMLFPELIDYGFRNNFQEFDFLRGDEPYKRRFARLTHATWRVQAWKREWGSRLKAAAYFSLRPLVYRQRWAARLGLPYTPHGEI